MPTVYIGMGANLPSAAGPPEATLARAAERLEELGRVTARSRLYSTEPVGYAGQPRFVNAVVALETELTPRALLGELLELERDFGRDRATGMAGIANGPRTLDLDLLFFGDLIVDEFDLKVPHPRIEERAFVVVPLADIAPELRDPRTGASVRKWMQRLFPIPTGAESQDVQLIQSTHWRSLRDCDSSAGGAQSADDAGDGERG